MPTTKNLTPGTDGEGSLGTAVRRWAAVHALRYLGLPGFRRSSATVAVGEVILGGAGLPSHLRLECVVAGTCAAVEPDLSAVAAGQYVTDGTAVFVVDDVRDGTPVGAVRASTFVPPGYVLANGATVNRADFPRLVALATAHNLWTASPSVNPGLFGVGNGESTMILPNWVGRMAQFAATAGGAVAAGLPNITGSVAFGEGGTDNAFGIMHKLVKRHSHR